MNGKFCKERILRHAQKAELPETFCEELAEYLDFLAERPAVSTALEEYDRILFGGKALFPIIRAEEFPAPEESEQKYPGFFRTVAMLAAADFFDAFLKTHDLYGTKHHLEDTYYRNLKRLMKMNEVRDGTWALIRHTHFLYGYARPFILRIGRLAYELRQYDSSWQICEDERGNRRFVPRGEPIPDGCQECIRRGDYYITVHIPGEGRLDDALVEESLQDAMPILREVFAEYAPKQILCDSWLLTPQITGFLKESSNILHFQRRFDIVKCHPEEKALFELVFQVPICPVSELVPRNDFQRSILSLYENGEVLWSGLGILKKEKNKL